MDIVDNQYCFDYLLVGRRVPQTECGQQVSPSLDHLADQDESLAADGQFADFMFFNAGFLAWRGPY
jgi:hypothetical protein